jgi:cyclopropane-fatty-acyl-phospholipid synthase
MAFARTGPLRRELETALPDRPFDISFWDGTQLQGTREGPTFFVRSPAAAGHMLRSPGQLGLGRAYVSGAIDVDDLDAVLKLLDDYEVPEIERREKLRLAAAGVQAAGLQKPPPIPAAELRLHGRRHTIARDRRAVRHHYDVSNDFFRLFLDESMTYSCAFFSRADDPSSLESAQQAKQALTASKLDLHEGDRVLDVGCGWGSFCLHVAREHGVSATGITLSEPQAELARQRAAEAGLQDRVDIRVMDYRELAGEPYDAIASIGMVEHVGGARIDEYAETLARLLKPGGRLLNHGIARLDPSSPEGGPFSERYVFPDGAPLQLSRIQAAFERVGLETLHVEGFRSDYAETLKHWAQRFDANVAEAERIAGSERTRVWRLYLRASRNGFETGFLSIFQVRCVKP